MSDDVLLEFTDGEAARITLNRPAKRNAVTQAMWRRLPEILAQVESDPRAKLLVVRGAGGNFAAGADIGEFETVYATRDSTAAYFGAVGAAMEALARLSKPTIAHIEGACVGGGMGLALCCDLRLAANTARMGITPGKLGLVYSLADTKRLVDAVGASAAKDILFTGRILEAGEALSLRLVDAVHPAEALEAAVTEKARAISAASQWSVRKSKQVIEMIRAGAAAETPETAAWLLDAVEGADFAEGRDAFLAKRSPVFPFR
jgi:enoyl-CoA hydratase/carnithine racemase